MASETLGTELREQGRGVVGALLVIGVSALYTIETWWAGWQLSSGHLVTYAVVGLAVVLAITRNVGFRNDGGGDGGGDNSGDGGSAGSGDGSGDGGGSDGRDGDRDGPGGDDDGWGDEDGERGDGSDGKDGGEEDDEVTGKQAAWRVVVTDFFEILVQSFVAAYGYYLLFGLVELTEPVTVVARLGLVGVVPLGFGAALANEVLAGSHDGPDAESFPSNLAVVGLGAVFFAAPIAPTEEVAILAASAGWWRLAAVVVATLLVVQLTLYELEFRGQQRRLQGLDRAAQWAQTAVVYALGCAAAFGLLAMFGGLAGQPVVVWVQKTVVLGFPASIGGSAARVVL